jgi:signal transduction histidine kinase
MIEILDKNFIDNLQVSVYTKDLHGKYTYCNNHMAKTLGLSDRKYLIGQSDNDLFLNQYAEQLKYVDSQVIINNKVMVVEEQVVSLLDPSEEKINFLSIRTPIKDKDQQMMGIAGISINLDQQDTADFNLHLLKELIHTNILTVLRQVKHDIRGPLGALSGFAELVLEAKNEPERIVHLANYLLKGCSAIDKFIDSLTNSCIYYQNRSDDHKTIFNLNELVQNICDIANPMAYQSKLELHYTNELDHEFTMFGFKDVIFRILMELTNNALKYTKKGEVNVKVYPTGKGNPVINIDVSNTGAALTQEQISRILTTRDLAHDDLMKGQGFGLSMIGALAKSIGSDIKVSSTQELGTTITLMIKNEKVN